MGEILSFVSLIFTYPEFELATYEKELNDLHSKKKIDKKTFETLRESTLALFDKDTLDVQSHYISIFDQKKACALYLFEHAYGDSRERGTALVELTKVYQSYGYEATDELPDFLPMYLEFLSVLPENVMKAKINEIGRLLSALYENIRAYDTHYSHFLKLVIDEFKIKRS